MEVWLIIWIIYCSSHLLGFYFLELTFSRNSLTNGPLQLLCVGKRVIEAQAKAWSILVTTRLVDWESWAGCILVNSTPLIEVISPCSQILCILRLSSFDRVLILWSSLISSKDAEKKFAVKLCADRVAGELRKFLFKLICTIDFITQSQLW